MLEAAIDAGAEDVQSGEGGHEIYTTPDSLGTVAKALEAKFGEPRKAALIWKPQNTVAVDDEQGEKLLKLIEIAQRARRRAERLCQFRDLRRADAEAERVSVRRRRVSRLGEPAASRACILKEADCKRTACVLRVPLCKTARARRWPKGARYSTRLAMCFGPDVTRCTIRLVQGILADAVVPGPPIANGRVHRAP